MDPITIVCRLSQAHQWHDDELVREVPSYFLLFEWLTPKDISSTPFPTLLRQHLSKQFVDSSIFGTYNTACTFIKHMKYSNAELNELDSEKDRTCVVCNFAAPLRCSRCKSSFYCSVAPEASWMQHKRECEGLLAHRNFHKGMLLLNRCIQEPGAGDGPTSVILEFLGSGVIFVILISRKALFF